MTKKERKRYKYWSEKEINLLKKLYPNILLKDLARFFPKRNKGTIVAKAMELKLKSAKLWQSEENYTLRQYFSNKPLEKLLKLLPRRSKLAILAQGERLGLKRNTHVPRKSVNESYFKKWTPNMAYILGFILTDGCIIKGTYKGYSDSLKFGVQLKDIDILRKIKKELSSQHKISLVKNAAHLSISSQKIVDDLKKLGIRYRKSLRENVPKIPRQYIINFIRGVVDGDGSIHFDKKGYPFLSIYGGGRTITFVQNYFFSKFGIYSKVTKRTKSKNRKYYLFTINYHCNPAKVLINHLYKNANLYLERKFKLARRCMTIIMKKRNNHAKIYRK